MEYTCASFFAGVGGIDLGFENEGFKVIYANEIDEFAVQTYEKNSSIKVDNRDIRDVKVEELPEFDILLAGFPCQAFSIAGYREGFNDKKGRGNLFFELERIFEIKKPKVIFLENVKNFLNHDNGKTFEKIYNSLTKNGYHVEKKVCNSSEYGNIPQNRERIYIIAFLDEKAKEHFKFPNPIPLTKKFKSYINNRKPIDKKYYYTKENCYFYEELASMVKRRDTAYQWRRKYVRENKSNLCPTLTANMGTGGHNVPIVLDSYGIRKITPKECFAFQGYPKDFELANLSNTRLYKQAGNSVVVPVIERFAYQIKTALDTLEEE